MSASPHAASSARARARGSKRGMAGSGGECRQLTGTSSSLPPIVTTRPFTLHGVACRDDATNGDERHHHHASLRCRQGRAQEKPMKIIGTLAGIALLGGCGTTSYKPVHETDFDRL